MAETDVHGLIRRTRQYEFADGLRDLQLSLMLGAGGVMVWFVSSPWWVMLLDQLIRRYGRWAAWAGLLWVFLPGAMAWGMVAVMRALRRHWLWARTGDVTPARMVVPRRVNLIGAVILIGGIAVGVLLWTQRIVDDTFALRILWAATGWSFGYTLLGIGREIGVPRFIWIGPIGGAASTLVLVPPISFGQAALFLGLGWCVILGVSGAVTLRQAWLRAGEVGDVRSD